MLDRATATSCARCSGLQSSSVLLANIGDFCSDYLRMTGPEYSRSLRTCSAAAPFLPSALAVIASGAVFVLGGAASLSVRRRGSDPEA